MFVLILFFIYQIAKNEILTKRILIIILLFWCYSTFSYRTDCLDTTTYDVIYLSLNLNRVFNKHTHIHVYIYTHKTSKCSPRIIYLLRCKPQFIFSVFVITLFYCIWNKNMYLSCRRCDWIPKNFQIVENNALTLK